MIWNMPTSKLAAALQSIDWNKNVATFLSDKKATQQLADANLRLAVWSRQFEITDHGNPALCFVREMQVSGHQVAALAALALYKSAAASMRAMFETALYYSYFRTHLSELATLVRDKAFYVEKRELIEYHKRHTVRFIELERALGVLSRLDKWYSLVSSVIHGQVPGKWAAHASLSEIKPHPATQELAIQTFVEGVDIVHRLFLCTVGQDLWDGFSAPSKKELLAGLHGDIKKVLRLDAA